MTTDKELVLNVLWAGAKEVMAFLLISNKGLEASIVEQDKGKMGSE